MVVQNMLMYLRHMDLLQFLEDVSPLIQEASSVITGEEF